jgi:hypothetical protein
MKKTPTIDLKGKAYATVPARIKEFREDNPNGLIETKPEILENEIMFSARILKDKANPFSGEATGHAIGKKQGDKAFEKLETIAVGRALALLGYMASGDIASGEEMEEYIEYQKEKKESDIIEAKQLLSECKNLKELQETWVSLGTLIKEPEVLAKKDELKLTLK